MYKNIGSKVMTLAKILCWIGILASVIIGLIMIFGTGRSGILPGILTLVFGSFFSWLASWVTYAIGKSADYAERHEND